MVNNHIHIGQDRLFTRFEGNPILVATDVPYPVHTVFNPGAIEFNGETILLLRVEDLRGFSHLTVARSKDGKSNWNIDDTPTLSPSSYFSEEMWGLEDPRIVYLEDDENYAITYTSHSPAGPQVSLAITEDFKNFERMGSLLPPEDKDACLFPKKFDGRYALIHRPIVRNEAHVWISFSPDLIHWGEHRILIPTRGGWWDCSRVGLGPQPVFTEEGWLVIYHGVRATTAGDLYRVGCVLLDAENPCKVLRRSEEWIFGPRENYEFIGDVPGVVFPSGMIYEEKDEKLLRMYYGAADTSVCLATANMDDILEYIKNCPEQ